MNETSVANPQKNFVRPRLSISPDLLFFKNDLLGDLKELEAKITKKIKTENDETLKRIVQIENQLGSLTQKIFAISNSNLDNTQLIERVKALYGFNSKMEKSILNHDCKLSAISKDLTDAINKFDRLIENNILYQGVIGTNNARFQTFHSFIDYVLTNLSNLISFKDKTLSVDFKQYKKQLDSMAEGLKKKYNELLSNSKDFTSQCVLNIEKRIKDDSEIYDKRLFDLSIKNSEHCMNLEKITNNLINEWEKIAVIKNEMEKTCNSTLKGLKKHYVITENRLSECIKGYNDIKKKYDILIEFMKGIKASGLGGVGTRMIYPEFLNYKENQNEHKKKNNVGSNLKKYIAGETGTEQITELNKKNNKKKEENENNNNINCPSSSSLNDNNKNLKNKSNNNIITINPLEMNNNNNNNNIQYSQNNSLTPKVKEMNDNNIIINNINEKKIFNQDIVNQNTTFKDFQVSYFNIANNKNDNNKNDSIMNDSNEENDKSLKNYPVNDNSITIVQSKKNDDNKEIIDNKIKDFTINNNNTIEYNDNVIIYNHEIPNNNKKNESKISKIMSSLKNMEKSSENNDNNNYDNESNNDIKIVKENDIIFDNNEQKDKKNSNFGNFVLTRTNDINYLGDQKLNNIKVISESSPSDKINNNQKLNQNNNNNNINPNINNQLIENDDINNNIEKTNNNKNSQNDIRRDNEINEKNKNIINVQDKENNTTIKTPGNEISISFHNKYYPTNKIFEFQESNFHFHFEKINKSKEKDNNNNMNLFSERIINKKAKKLDELQKTPKKDEDKIKIIPSKLLDNFSLEFNLFKNKLIQ